MSDVTVEVVTRPVHVAAEGGSAPNVTVEPAREVHVTVSRAPTTITATEAQALSLSYTAGAVLSGHRIVRANASGQVVYASNATLTDAGKALGLTRGAASSGSAVSILHDGVIEEPSWNWDTSLPVYLGSSGQLTQTAPTVGSGAVFLQIVGVPLTPTRLYLDIRQAFALA